MAEGTKEHVVINATPQRSIILGISNNEARCRQQSEGARYSDPTVVSLLTNDHHSPLKHFGSLSLLLRLFELVPLAPRYWFGALGQGNNDELRNQQWSAHKSRFSKQHTTMSIRTAGSPKAKIAKHPTVIISLDMLNRSSTNFILR